MFSVVEKQVHRAREIYVAILLVMLMCSMQGKVRLYRRSDNRLSHKSKVLTTWYRYKSDATYGGHDHLAYVDMPEFLLLACSGDDYGRCYTLKGTARRYARRSWKVLKAARWSA